MARTASFPFIGSFVDGCVAGRAPMLFGSRCPRSTPRADSSSNVCRDFPSPVFARCRSNRCNPCPRDDPRLSAPDRRGQNTSLFTFSRHRRRRLRRIGLRRYTQDPRHPSLCLRSDCSNGRSLLVVTRFLPRSGRRTRRRAHRQSPQDDAGLCQTVPPSPRRCEQGAGSSFLPLLWATVLRSGGRGGIS